jgi:dsDNA-binding SOS-regulon protein
MRVFSPREEMGGHLESIEVYADGFERWTAIGDDGKKMIDASNWFWLEISQYRHLFAVRVLGQDAIYQKLREALALYEEKGKSDDHDKIIQLHRRLDSILKFMNGDIEGEQRERIASAYQQMLWGSVSLNESQREEVARQIATKIDRLRRSSYHKT